MPDVVVGDGLHITLGPPVGDDPQPPILLICGEGGQSQWPRTLRQEAVIGLLKSALLGTANLLLGGAPLASFNRPLLESQPVLGVALVREGDRRLHSLAPYQVRMLEARLVPLAG